MLFLHWAANTLLQASAFMRFLYPFNLIAASFCLLTSLWLLSAFGVTKDSSASSFFISPPGAIDRLFWQLRGRCTLLDFKFKFQEFNDKQILKFKFFWCWWLVKNYLQVNKSNIQLFLVLFGTWKQDKRFISSKKFNEITIKVRAIFIYLFIILFRHGLSVFFIIQN